MISILVASTDNGSLVYLTGTHTKEELAAARRKTQFSCPTCGSSVILKVGEVKTPHFAHKNLSHCASYSEAESSMHLHGKLLLYQFFLSQNLTVELEKYFPVIRQRADLLINQHTAIEFQCSPIPAAQIMERTLGYTRSAVQTIWIGGLSEPLAEGIQELKLTHWKKEMLLETQKSPYLLLFSPKENRFYYCSNLIYISGSRWIVKVKSLAASKQQFPFAVPKQMTLAEFKTMSGLFDHARKKFIIAQYYSKNRVQNPFWRTCYEMGIDIRNLPKAIGLPMKNADLINCNAVLWQLQAVEAACKGITAASLIRSGKIPVHKSAAAKEAEALVESYLSLYEKLKGKSNQVSGYTNLLYDFYCKTL
ncbi:competence protein CoiA [Planomicrobium soli]|uniref:competence protein CoiA n=1 Tax=Planomicrobium soli TaxID=1176648 RepID=UPI0015E73AC8|nr:competence protein CoiA family protein [Planomicrobium soli]